MSETERRPQLDPLVADARALRKRLLGLKWDNPDAGRTILCNEIIPLIIAGIERVIEVDELVEEMVEHEESYLQDDHAAHLTATLGLAVQLAQEVALNISVYDDLVQQRLKKLLLSLEKGVEFSLMIIASAAASDDDIEDDDIEEDDAEDDDEDTLDPDDQDTPIEIPTKNEAE